MKKVRLSKYDVDRILNDKLPAKYWEFELGVGLQYEYAPDNIRFSAPYPKMGSDLWKSFKYELYELLCDNESKEPKEWLSDLVTGDFRNLIVAVCSAITAKYDVTLGIALPASALVIKAGILKYCSTRPRKKPKQSVGQILLRKKKGFKKRKD